MPGPRLKAPSVGAASFSAVKRSPAAAEPWFRSWGTWVSQAVGWTTTSYANRKGRWDEVKLWQMGYKQGLPRTMTFFNNAGTSFSVLSFFALVESYSTQGLTYGGPVVVIWGWLVCSFFSLCIAACMAELVSAFPTSGGLYYWAWILAPPRWRNLACWLTGWLNLLGQVAFTTSLEISLVRFLETLVALHTRGNDGSPGYAFTNEAVMLIFVGLLVAHAAMNSASHHTTSVFISFSAFWHMVAASAFFIVLALVAPTHQTNSFVWTEWQPNTDVHGISSPAYIVLVGLLMSQWIIMGYDSSVHMAEETIDADNAASWGIVASVAGCSVLGLGFLLSLTYSVQSLDNIFDPDSATGGKAVAQITWDVFEARYGSGRGAIPMLYIPAVGLFFCAFTSMASNGRMVYAFSRDGAMLGSRMWSKLNNWNHLPVAGTWFMAFLSFLMGLPAIYNVQAFITISAVSVISLSLSFMIPIAFRFWHGSEGFIAGPFRLGRWSRVLGALSCGWIALVTVVFCLPPIYPIHLETMNYASVLLIALLSFALFMWWMPGFGGCHWFRGPTPNCTVPDAPTEPTQGSHQNQLEPAGQPHERAIEHSGSVGRELFVGGGERGSGHSNRGFKQTSSMGKNSRRPSHQVSYSNTPIWDSSINHNSNPDEFRSMVSDMFNESAQGAILSHFAFDEWQADSQFNNFSALQRRSDRPVQPDVPQRTARRASAMMLSFSPGRCSAEFMPVPDKTSPLARRKPGKSRSFKHLPVREEILYAATGPGTEATHTLGRKGGSQPMTRHTHTSATTDEPGDAPEPPDLVAHSMGANEGRMLAGTGTASTSGDAAEGFLLPRPWPRSAGGTHAATSASTGRVIASMGAGAPGSGQRHRPQQQHWQQPQPVQAMSTMYTNPLALARASNTSSGRQPSAVNWLLPTISASHDGNSDTVLATILPTPGTSAEPVIARDISYDDDPLGPAPRVSPDRDWLQSAPPTGMPTTADHASAVHIPYQHTRDGPVIQPHPQDCMIEELGSWTQVAPHLLNRPNSAAGASSVAPTISVQSFATGDSSHHRGSNPSSLDRVRGSSPTGHNKRQSNMRSGSGSGSGSGSAAQKPMTMAGSLRAAMAVLSDSNSPAGDAELLRNSRRQSRCPDLHHAAAGQKRTPAYLRASQRMVPKHDSSTIPASQQFARHSTPEVNASALGAAGPRGAVGPSFSPDPRPAAQTSKPQDALPGQ